ncbi:MAG: hypothetical protein KIT25_08670 [Enhydrobacter sp.]|nr:MAG: hypothetical protein KIT25_08670 [Enhydrobacter sp.]
MTTTDFPAARRFAIAPPGAYAVLRRAIVERRPMTAVYDDYVRDFCPRLLGRDRAGQPALLAYQYGGGRPGGLPSQGAWTFFVVDRLHDLRLNDDDWAAATPPCELHGGMAEIDVAA